jgi:hypothetical protein
MSNRIEVTVNDSGPASIVELIAQGPQGPPGLGSSWHQGAGAPSNATGTDGDYFLNTSNGDIYGPKVASAWAGVIFNIAEGQQGPIGATGPTGPIGPSGLPDDGFF